MPRIREALPIRDDMLLRAEDGILGTVYDLDTNRRVPKVIELNTDTGYVKAYFVVEQNDEHPELEKYKKVNGALQWYEAYGRFKFVPKESSATARTVVMGAPACVWCGSTLTLPGDELCPRCRASDRGQRNRFKVERLTTPLFDKQCEECTRTAAWSVSDEVEVTPELNNRILYDRGMTVGRRFYCDSHYEPARLLDPKGEVIQDLNYAGPDTVKEQADATRQSILGRDRANAG